MTLACRCASVLLATTIADPAGAVRGGDELLTSVRDVHVSTTLDVLAAKFKRTSPDEFEISHGDRTVWLTNHHTDCLIYTGFETGGRGDLGRINRWNARVDTATRAYLDRDGDPCLEMDVDVEGGISPFVFSLYFTAYFQAVDRFAAEVVGDPPAEPGASRARPHGAAPARPACPRFLSGAVAAVSGDEEVLLEPGRIENAILKRGYTFEALQARPGGPDFSIAFGKARTFAYLGGDGLSLATPFPGAKLTLQKANGWNRDHRFGRAYVDPEGRPVLADRLPVPLVSDSALAEFFEVYRATLGRFAKSARVERLVASRVAGLGVSGVPATIEPPPPSSPDVPAALPTLTGVRLTAVVDDSPAARAGLRVGDVIVSVSVGEELVSSWTPNVPDVPALVRATSDRSGIAWLWVARGGRYQEVRPVRVELNSR